jgi:hypothetical protein
MRSTTEALNAAEPTDESGVRQTPAVDRSNRAGVRVRSSIRAGSHAVGNYNIELGGKSAGHGS